MPPYLTERLLAAQLQLSPEAVDAIEAADTDEDAEWLLAFLSADQLHCYCLYQSACPRMISETTAQNAVAANLSTWGGSSPTSPAKPDP